MAPRHLAGDVVPSPAVGLRALPLPDGGLTVYSATRSTAYVMNPSAAQVWELLDGRRSVEQITARLEEVHRRGALGPDVTSILGDLQHAGLVELPPTGLR